MMLLGVIYQPECMHIYNNTIYFAHENQLYILSSGTNPEKIYETGTVKDKIVAIEVLDNIRIILSVHSYDENYNPTDNNGVYLIEILNVGFVSSIKLFPQKNNELTFIISIYNPHNENGILYAIDPKGNVFWFNTNGMYELMFGIDKKTKPNYFGGGESKFVNNIPEYDQSGRGIGIVSCVVVDNSIICSNYGLGILMFSKLSQDGKGIEGKLKIKQIKTGINFYSRVRSHNGHLYLGIASKMVSGKLNPGMQIVKIIGGKQVSILSNLGYVIDFDFLDDQHLLVLSLKNGAKMLSTIILNNNSIL